MPNYYQSFLYKTDPAILAFSEGNIAPISASVTNQYVTLNSDARFTVPAGLFIADMGTVLRFLPRAKVTSTAGTSTSSNNFTMSPYNIFAPGDTLYVLEPYVILTITASAATQTQTITVNGQTATATVSSSSVNQSAIEVAAAVNAHLYLSQWINALAVNGLVYLFAKDQQTLYGVTEGGTVTATLSNTVMAYNTTPLGTIQSINYPDGTITLSANASIALPANTNIGIPVKKILGLHVHSIDYTIFTEHSCNCYTTASGVRIQYLPYYDHSLKLTFPKMTFDYIF